MKFRTEIEELHGSFGLGFDDRIVMLGSCFSDSIGERLAMDGFHVTHNPMGPLFNPLSVERAYFRRSDFVEADFYHHGDLWHCMDGASRYAGADCAALAEAVNADRRLLTEALEQATAVIFTFGSVRAYRLRDTGAVVANCHRLPAAMFDEIDLDTESIVRAWTSAGLPKLPPKVIFTLSPIRYTAYGLAANSLSKAVLRVAIDRICLLTGADYFPAYEIVNDDLRDYRYYAPDMKHPSDVAVEYIYEKFTEAYCTPQIRQQIAENHRLALRNCHIDKKK